MSTSVLPIFPICHALDAHVRVPGSKSLTNRALLLAALAEGETVLENALFSDDSRYFARALQDLGFDIHMDETRQQVRIYGLGGRIPARNASLFIGNAGTAARFLTAFLTLGQGEFRLDGDTRMRQRPIGDLVQALRSWGAEISTVHQKQAGRAVSSLPILIRADGLRGGKTSVTGNISSQFLSALLMIAPYTQQTAEIAITTELFSKPYVEMTLRIMQHFGLNAKHDAFRVFQISAGKYQPQPRYAIEADASAASYFFAAPAICGGSVTVSGLSRHALQGDLRFLEVLTGMGCHVEESSAGICVTRGENLHGIQADLRDLPDTAQTLAVIAPFASSPTHIRGVGSSRFKETDRISAVCAELSRLGVTVEEHTDGMTIHPCRRFRASASEPVMVRTYNDHRMAMAFSLLGLRVEGIQIENPGCVAKTFPDFFTVLEQLR